MAPGGGRNPDAAITVIRGTEAMIAIRAEERHRLDRANDQSTLVPREI